MLLPGCATQTVRVVEPFSVPARPVVAEATLPPDPVAGVEPATGGVTHVVLPGQTAWRIARTYGISLEDLANANAIDDPTRIEAGRQLFIPGAPAVLEVEIHPGIASVTRGAGDWVWPVAGGTILSHYGAARRTHRHTGLDIAAGRGAPVRAARGGRVVYTGATMRGYGKTVIVDHGDGLRSLYAHNSALVVRTGQSVYAGQTIARVGSTGNASTEHCHFEIRENDRPLDPLRFFTTENERHR